MRGVRGAVSVAEPAKPSAPGGHTNAALASLGGCDPGVCFKSEYFPDAQTSITGLSNYGDNVWRIHEMQRAEFVPAKQ